MEAAGDLALHPARPEGDAWWRRVWHEGAVSVLVVSEALAWRAELAGMLEAEAYAVRVDDHGAAAFEPSCPFDVAVVDLAITGRSPIAVFAALHLRRPVPILAVSPEGAREVSALRALESGADQILTRGARSNELMARIRALLRQTPPQHRTISAAAARCVPSIRLDMATGIATVVGRTVPLTRGEAELLHALLMRPGRVVTRDDLAMAHPGALADGGLDGLVRGIRAKLEAVEGWRRIVAVRGVGLRLLSDAEQARGEPPAR